MTPRTYETRESWLSSRVAHMTTCADTQVELLDEIMDSDGTPEKLAMMAALRAITIDHPINSTPWHRAIGAVQALLEAQALIRARGEWERLSTAHHLAQSIGDRTCHC